MLPRAGHWANNWSGIDVLMFFFIHGCILHCEEEILEDLGSYSPGTLLMIFTICKVFDEILTGYIGMKTEENKQIFLGLRLFGPVLWIRIRMIW
jgi:hypothetical protein